MRLFSNPRHPLVVTGIAAAVLALSALSAAQAQDSYAQDSSAAAGKDGPSAGTHDAASRVKAALKSDATLESKHIDVSMVKGDIVLTGFVQSAEGVTRAARIATRAAGRHKIVNQLTVQQEPANAP